MVDQNSDNKLVIFGHWVISDYNEKPTCIELYSKLQ